MRFQRLPNITQFSPLVNNKAKEALEDVKESVEFECINGTAPVFTVHGLGTFGKQVLFAKIEAGQELILRIGAIARAAFERRGIVSTDKRPLNLHATIAKLSKAPKLRKKGLKEISHEWWVIRVNCS